MINYIDIIKAINELGDVMYQIQPHFNRHSLVVGGAKNTWLGVFQGQEVELYDAKTGELKHTVANKNMDGLSFGTDGDTAGNFISKF